MSIQKSNDLLNFDRRHIWHPYTSMIDPLPVYEVVSAQGVRLRLADGRELIDGMSSWWAAIHGYNHPVLNAAVRGQVERMSHVMFGGLTHGPAVGLCSRLVEMTPAELTKVFLCDSGSVAVEAAIKMAFQYWIARGCSDRTRLLTVRSGYHGDTFGAMAVCDPVNGMHDRFSGIMARHFFAPSPGRRFHDEWDESDIREFVRIMEENHSRIAAVIMEPIVQGAGGMRFYHPTYLKRVRELTERYGVLLILDEIAAGFGRSGTMFGADHAGVVPDIMCLGKALTGGYLTLAAVMTSEKVSRGIAADGVGVFMHGPTFMGNPLACAVAGASLDLLTGSPWKENIARIENRLRTGLDPAAGLAGVREVRVLGAVGVIELEDPVNMAVIQKRFVDRGVWIRPFGRLVYAMPPYIISDDELDRLTKAMIEVVAFETGEA